MPVPESTGAEYFAPAPHAQQSWSLPTPNSEEADIGLWRQISLDPDDDAWVFPSETGKTPLGRDNVWRRRIGPKLKAVGLEWVDFHVMRRTHSTLMNEIHDDPKLVADQLGHTVDVNQNVYTRASVARRKSAVDALENALPVI